MRDSLVVSVGIRPVNLVSLPIPSCDTNPHTETCQGVDSVNVHGTASANTLATTPPERQGGVHLVLDPDERHYCINDATTPHLPTLLINPRFVQTLRWQFYMHKYKWRSFLLSLVHLARDPRGSKPDFYRVRRSLILWWKKRKFILRELLYYNNEENNNM